MEALCQPSRTMVAIEISSVETMNIGSRDIVGAYLDDPEIGDETERYCLLVRGWCISRSAPLERIQLFYGNDCIADVTPFNRPDVQYAVPGEPFALRSGFSFAVSALCLPAFGTLSLWTKLASGIKAQIGRIELATRIPLLNNPDHLKPLIVFSVGRSGSTALMKLLTAHPEISGHMPYPLETRFAQHTYHAMRIASSFAPSYAEDMMTAFTARRPMLGPNPSFGYFKDLDGFFHQTYAPGLIERHMEMIDAFYRAQKSVDEQKPRFFAEKSTQDSYVVSVLDKIDGARRIMLMRDPRDIMVSIRKFNEQTGYLSFGAERVSSFAEHAELIRASIEWHLEAAGWEDERSIFLKYEDMIADWTETATELFGLLGIADDEDTVEQAVRVIHAEKGGEVRHATSSSTSDSMGRWINDLEPEEKEICAAVFDDLLEKMGYNKHH